MKIGLICSAGGSACFSALDLLHENGSVGKGDVLVVTDRECDAEMAAADRQIECIRITESDAAEFSSHACSEFKDRSTDLVFLFYTRLVSSASYAGIPTFNIHPSLLPAFRGFGALDQAREQGVRFIGATLHGANEFRDAGPIVGQVVTPVQTAWDARDFARVSYIQKTYLLLCMVDLLQNGVVDTDIPGRPCRWLKPPPFTRTCNPSLMTHSLIDCFAAFQANAGIDALVP